MHSPGEGRERSGEARRGLLDKHSLGSCGNPWSREASFSPQLFLVYCSLSLIPCPHVSTLPHQNSIFSFPFSTLASSHLVMQSTPTDSTITSADNSEFLKSSLTPFSSVRSSHLILIILFLSQNSSGHGTRLSVVDTESILPLTTCINSGQVISPFSFVKRL